MIETKRIKICYVASADITIRFILLNHLQFLKREGYDVYATCASGKWVKTIEEKGIKVKTIGFKRKISPFSDIVSFFRLYVYFKREKFHIVHTHTIKAEFFGQIAAKLAGVPIIINTLHGLDFYEDTPFLKRKFFVLLERISAKSSTVIFSVNKKNINMVVQEKICSPEKIKYIGNGIDLKRFNPERFSQEFITSKKATLGIKKNQRVIGIVARLVAEKGYLDLFKAFKEILHDFPHTVLIIVGPLEPEKKDAINPNIVERYGIGDQIVFLGEKAETEEIYPLMDIFVLPSYREGLPYTILEASAMERPVVVTDVGGCSEAVESDNTGVIIKSKNPKEIVKAVNRLLSDSKTAVQMGKEGRKKIVNAFDEEMVFEKLKNEYQNLIEEKLKIKICCSVSVDMTLKFMLFSQLKFLQSQGYKVYATCRDGKWVKDIEQEGIIVKKIGFKRKPISPFSDILAFIRLFFYFKKEKFHIVHTNTIKPAFFGQIAAKLAGVPIIINTLRGFDFAQGDTLLKKKIVVFLEKISAKYSDLILSISHYVINEFIKQKICAPSMIQYLGRDIDTDRFNPERFSKDFILQKKREIGLQENDQVIGIVARLVTEKGYLDLFEAFKKVLVVFPNAKLLVIGQEEPEKNDALRKDVVKDIGIENSVIFLGERADVDEVYPLMDVFVLPTHREGLGAAILEASAMERPVIATDVGGCPEAVDHQKTGIVIPFASTKRPDLLTESIVYILENPEVAKLMGKEGRKKVIIEFKKEVVLKRLEEYYNAVIAQKIFHS